MSNFYLPSNANESYFPDSDVEKVRTNIKIIKLVKKLEMDNQSPSKEQQKLLAKYVGWGGLANTFFDEYDKSFVEERKELKALVSEDEYNGMRDSSLTAYYTNPAIAQTMWKKLVDDGFKGGNVLDPSMGTGIFFMTMPKVLRDKTKLYGVELDKITGEIAKLLFPDAQIFVEGFQDFKVVNKKAPFDLVITNVPFGDERILDSQSNRTYYIHDYFVKKSLQLVRDKGLVYIIASNGVMDKRTKNIFQEKEIKWNTQLLGAVRLPNNAFEKIAGTQATADMLFLQKVDRSEPEESPYTEEAFFQDAYLFHDDGVNKVYINRYFAEHQNQMLGTPKVLTYYNGRFTLKDDGNAIKKLPEALNRVMKPFESDASANDNTQVCIKKDNNDLKKSSFKAYEFCKDGNDIVYLDGQKLLKNTKLDSIDFYFNEKDELVGTNASPKKVQKFKDYAKGKPDRIYRSTSATTQGKYKGNYKQIYFFQVPYGSTELKRISGLIDIKTAYVDLIQDQLEKNGHKMTDFKKDLAKLNSVYDKFFKKYGAINLPVNANLFRKDNRFPLISSLEDQRINPQTGRSEFVKGQAFVKPLVSPNRKIANVKSARDALLTSMSENRGVDFKFMESIYPKHDKQALIDELGDQILIDTKYYLETNKVKYIPKEVYLSGDVVSKKEDIEKLIKNKDTTADWKHYLELLTKVIPKHLSITDISFKISSAWIPDEVVSKFIFDNFIKDSEIALGKFKKDKAGEWIIPDMIIHTMKGRYIDSEYNYCFTNSAHNDQMGLSVDGDVKMDGVSIFGNLLNSIQPVIYKTVGMNKNGKPIREIDQTTSDSLREKEKEMEIAFKDFVLQNPSISLELETTYNYKYNRIAPRHFDGSHLHINGLSKAYELRDYQKNAVQRIIETKRALLAHEVGTGKTLTMISAGFKMKELGLIHRPLFVVPTNLVAQFGHDILKFYPTKNVLIATSKDFKTENRKSFLSRIITQDYDAVVIGHSQFEKIRVDPEIEARYYKDRITSLDQATEEMENKSISVKGMVTMEKALKNKMKRLAFLNQDDFMTFEDLGVDFLFVDEAHNYKNFAPITSLGRIRGINSQTSKRAFDMQMKVQELHNKYNGTHVVFATGTPVSNSISELWVMMNYIQPDVLRKFGINHFDDFAGSFGLIKVELELDPTGSKYKEHKRFVKFVNLPELMSIYRITADIQMADTLNLQLPKARKFVITSNLTKEQKNYLDDLIKRSDDIALRKVPPTEDNMLKVTNDARKMTVDMRLINPAYSAEDSIKLSQLVSNVYRIYKRTTFNKGTQFIFSDIGTPNASKSFDVYHTIRKMLIKKGIPDREIAFMHDAQNEEAKLELERKANAGEIRILIGSTQKGGTGLNVQLRMKAAHHLDVPWRPSDIIQRNGRLIRQGNLFREVEIYHYITKGSFDNYLWQIQENKLKYITQVMTSRSAVRAMHDVDNDTLTAGDFKSIATSNPYLRLKMQLDNRVASLNNQKHAFERNRSGRASKIEEAKDKIIKLNGLIEGTKKDITDDNGNEIDYSNLKTTDIVFHDVPHKYDKPSEVNRRLNNEIRDEIYGFSDEQTDKTIATIGGYDIVIPAGGQMSYVFHTVTMYLRKGIDHEVKLYYEGGYYNTNKYQFGYHLIKAIKSFKSDIDYMKKKIVDYQNVIKIGLGEKEFKYTDDLKYAEAEKKLLDEHINDSKEQIAEKLQEFNTVWHEQHPEFKIPKGEQEQKVVIKYYSDPNDYDDSLFTDEPVKTKPKAKEPIKPVEKPVKTATKPVSVPSQNTKKTASKRKKISWRKAKMLKLFAYYASEVRKNSKQEKKEETGEATQLSLFSETEKSSEQEKEEDATQLSLF